MKKVLFLIFSPKLSGAEISMLRLIKESTFDIYVACGNKNLDIIGNYLPSKNIFPISSIESLNRNSNNIFSIIFKSLRIVFLLNYALAELVRENNFNLIYSNNSTLALYTIPFLLSQKVKRKNISFFWHEHTLVLTNTYSKYVEKINFHFYDKTIVSSKAVKKTFPYKKTALLYYGFSGHKFKTNIATRQNIRNSLNVNDAILIGVFGVISKNKGHHIILDVFNQVKKTNNKIKLLFLGKAYDQYYLDCLHRNIDSDVIFIEWTDNVEAYYCAIDILINVSDSQTSEAFGLTLAEAMLFEKIVLGSNTGGIPEIIDDGVDGFLFEPGNIEDLTNKIECIIKNIDELDYIKKNARQKIIHKYSIGKMVSTFNNIIGVE